MTSGRSHTDAGGASHGRGLDLLPRPFTAEELAQAPVLVDPADLAIPGISDDESDRFLSVILDRLWT